MAQSDLPNTELKALEAELQEVKEEFVPPASPRSRVATAVRALRHRNFQLFFAGQLISLIGTWMQTVAQSWLVYRLTGSTLLLGTVGFASQIPVFLVAPIGGTVADRFNRRRIVIATQTTSMILAFILAGLTLTHRIQVWQIMLLAAGLGVVNAFDIPARQAFLMDMVGREDLMNAIALNSSMFNGARILGPAVAGIVVAWVGEGWCFFVNAVSYIAVIAGLLMMKITHPLNLANQGSPMEHILEGFRFVVTGGADSRDPAFAGTGEPGGNAVFGADAGVCQTDPAWRSERTRVLMGATGVGALLGALSLATRVGVRGIGKAYCNLRGRIRREPDSVLVFETVLAVDDSAGAGRIHHDGADGVVEHAVAVDGARPDAGTRHRGLFDDVHGYGAFRRVLRGAIAHHVGAPWTVAIGGVACIAGAIVFGLDLPKFRREARELVLAQGMTAGTPAQGASGQGLS